MSGSSLFRIPADLSKSRSNTSGSLSTAMFVDTLFSIFTHEHVDFFRRVDLFVSSSHVTREIHNKTKARVCPSLGSALTTALFVYFCLQCRHPDFPIFLLPAEKNQIVFRQHTNKHSDIAQ